MCVTSEGRSHGFDSNRQSATAGNRGSFNLLFAYLEKVCAFKSDQTSSFFTAHWKRCFDNPSSSSMRVLFTTAQPLAAVGSHPQTKRDRSLRSVSSVNLVWRRGAALLKWSKMPMVLRNRKSIHPSQPSEVELQDPAPRTARRSTRLHARTTYEVGIFITQLFRLLFLRRCCCCCCWKLHRRPRSSLANVNGSDVSWLTREKYSRRDYIRSSLP